MKQQSSEWRHVADDFTTLARKWSEAGDLTVWAGPGDIENDAPGSYQPKLTSIEIETLQTFGDDVMGSEVGVFTEVKTQLTWPKATGILAHESAHARWSKAEGSDLKSLTPSEVETFMLLEEARIEKLMLAEYPNLRLHLRTSAIYLVNPDTAETRLNTGGVGYAARILLLGNSRIDAGILTADDMAACNAVIGNYFHTEVLEKLQALWIEFQNLEHKDEELDRMKDIAVEVNRLIEKAKEDNGEPTDNEMEDLIAALLELMALLDIEGEIDGGREIQKLDNVEKKKKQQQHQAEIDHRKTLADRIFNVENNKLTKSRIDNERPPTPDEKAAAHKIKLAFEKAKYRDRLIVEQSRNVPPGRMRVAQAMQKSAGAGGKLEPWKKKQHKHVEDESLTLAIMCDISGSMRRTMKPMASAAWIFSEATRRIGGNMAAVNYGYSVTPVIRPGEHYTKVIEFTAPDGAHDFDTAFKALDGRLNLLYARGARILVVCSDGNYDARETKATEEWLTACKAHGVAVVWLGLSQGRGQAICQKTGAKYIPVGEDATAAIKEIALACTQALNTASRVG